MCHHQDLHLTFYCMSVSLLYLKRLRHYTNVSIKDDPRLKEAEGPQDLGKGFLSQATNQLEYEELDHIR